MTGSEIYFQNRNLLLDAAAVVLKETRLTKGAEGRAVCVRIQYTELLFLPVIVGSDTNVVSHLIRSK